MTIHVKNFIERNIDLIEYQSWDDLYDEAHTCLSNNSIKELNTMLKDILNIPADEFARENIMKHLAMELMNFKQQKDLSAIYFASFVINFMHNKINGLDFDEFQNMAVDYIKDDKDLIIQFDTQGDVVIQKVKVI